MATKIGYLAVRRSIFIAAPPERIWQEFTSFERMARWFGTGHKLTRFEPRLGGIVEFDASDPDSGTLVFGGPIVSFDPPNELTFESNWRDHDWQAPPFITFRLTAVPGGTVVELFSHSFERIGPGGPEEHAGCENGWTTLQLRTLHDVVAGG